MIPEIVARVSPMPFGWGANPNGKRGARPANRHPVTNAFRLGG